MARLPRKPINVPKDVIKRLDSNFNKLMIGSVIIAVLLEIIGLIVIFN